jgi:hypothetical protein
MGQHQPAVAGQSGADQEDGFQIEPPVAGFAEAVFIEIIVNTGFQAEEKGIVAIIESYFGHIVFLEEGKQAWGRSSPVIQQDQVKIVTEKNAANRGSLSSFSAGQ